MVRSIWIWVLLSALSGGPAQAAGADRPGTDISQLSALADTHALAASGGAGSTGGGNEKALVAGLAESAQPEAMSLDEARRDFVAHARAGANELEKYAMVGWTFAGERRLAKRDIVEARRIIDDLEAGRGGKTFVLDAGLVNPATGEPRLAQNSRDGAFTLNPVEWARLSARYSVGSATLLRRAVAIHEILQQSPIRKEGTGDFTFVRPERGGTGAHVVRCGAQRRPQGAGGAG